MQVYFVFDVTNNQLCMHAGVLCAFMLDRGGPTSTASLFCKEGCDQNSRMPGAVLYSLSTMFSAYRWSIRMWICCTDAGGVLKQAAAHACYC